MGEVKLHVTTPTPEPVIFENICVDSVLKVAKNISGSGGPKHIDADGWRHILCCKSYKVTKDYKDYKVQSLTTAVMSD